MTTVGQAADLADQKLASAGSFTPMLLLFGGDADGTQLVAVAIEKTGEPNAQSARIEFVGLAAAVESDRGDEQALGSSRFEAPVQRKAKAAGFLDAEDGDAFDGPASDQFHELIRAELARGLGRERTALNDGHDEFQVDIESDLDGRTVQRTAGSWKRLTGRSRPWVALGRAKNYGLRCHGGFEKVYFHRYSVILVDSRLNPS
jgi:hypothetical protein